MNCNVKFLCFVMALADPCERIIRNHRGVMSHRLGTSALGPRTSKKARDGKWGISVFFKGRNSLSYSDTENVCTRGGHSN